MKGQLGSKSYRKIDTVDPGFVHDLCNVRCDGNYS